MSDSLHRAFNAASFSQDRYAALVKKLEGAFGPVGFRPCETPVLIDAALADRMAEAGREIVMALLRDPTYMQAAGEVVPSRFRGPNEPARPTFIAADFAIVRAPGGALEPRLVEVQGGTPMYAFTAFMAQAYKEAYGLDDTFSFLPEGQDAGGFLAKMKEEILGGCAPENVALVDVAPARQKFYMDFLATARLLGVKIVGVEEIVRHGNRLYYKDDGGNEVRIARICNRLVPEEFILSGTEKRAQFSLLDDLDVTWAGHPNWYFRLSKFSLPFINHPLVPESRLLGPPESWPKDLSGYVLKPLFSFGGHGVKVDVSRADLEAVPEAERGRFMLMRRINYASFIPDPSGGGSRAEIRLMMFYGENDARPEPSVMWARVSKGKMFNVGFNKESWTGAAPVFVKRPCP